MASRAGPTLSAVGTAIIDPMAELDPFTGAIASEAQLRERYDAPMERAVRKQLDRLDAMARRLIAVAPMVIVASHDADGRCDVTPRGGPPGFVSVLDDDHVAIPDATGNNRLDTLQNVVETGAAALIFLVPGRTQTLRVHGRACVSADPELLDGLTAVGKPPKSAIVVRADEVFAHCPKAFVRSRLWDPDAWPSAEEQPTPAEVSLAHMQTAYPDLTLADVERQQADALRYRLA